MTLVFAFLAGVLSILSPCVLPLVPLVLGAASSEHRYGPLALAAGLALSFAAIGLFIATIGFAIGLDGEIIRKAGAVLMLAIGTVLVFPALPMAVSAAAGPLANLANERFGDGPRNGLTGQFAGGLLLGAVWAPCVGPTLGAASVLAAKGESLGLVALTMIVFGIGAGLPLVLFGLMSRASIVRLRGRFLAAGKAGKLVFGLLFAGIGLAILTGMDKAVEAQLLLLYPDWLTGLTTRF